MVLNMRFSADIEAKLQDRASASGRNVEQIVLEAVEEKLAGPSNGVPADSAATANDRLAHWRRWVLEMENWASQHLPAGHVADDRRESIYPDRD